jgi:crotonobetainyl-CoA:carnitine CoA-transferase CaiB-like acyl-CoA transferase
MFLADLGASVIKVEPLPTGDPARESGPFDGGESVYYLASNRNKRSVAINLRHPEGREIARRLVATADVFVHNFKPGTVDKMGLDYGAIASSNPSIVYCSISGFGTTGVGRGLPGFDQAAQAMSGLMSVTGTSDTGPLRVGVPIADYSAGVAAALGILAALLRRAQTGQGGIVETSLFGTLLSMLSYQAQKYLSLGVVAGQDGNDHPLMFPQGSFPAADGQFTLASGNDAMWRTLCRIIGASELADDERFIHNEGRMRNRRILRQLLEERLKDKPVAHWITALNDSGIPASPIYDAKEALSSDVARDLGLIGEVEHSSIGLLKVLGTGLEVDRSGPWLRLPPPQLGEHTEQVLRELGLDSGEIDRLSRHGVVLARRTNTPRGPEDSPA